MNMLNIPGGAAKPAMPSAPPAQYPPLRGPAILGLSTGIAFLAGFLAWAVIAPMESAAIAPGTLQVEGNRKTVQHLEGGIVAELRVQEGTVVKAGDTLVRLDDTLARASADQLGSQFRAAVAQEARLTAERDARSEIVFPKELMSHADEPSVAEMLTSQQRIFASRRESIESQTVILGSRNKQAEEQIDGLRAQVRAQNRQLDLIGEEIAAVEELVNKGLEKKPRLLTLQRAAAETESQRARNLSEIARIRQMIGENDLRVVDLKTQFLSDVVKSLREEQTRIYDLRERIRAAEDVLARTIVRAPVSGKIVGLKLFTLGGVIQPREPLMDIVPAEESLVVEAQVTPSDIDTVRVGLPVRLQFSAFNHWAAPVIDGTVIDLSGDRLTDQRTGNTYYTARIAAKREQLVEHRLELYPGMPVEAMITTGERTFAEYLLRPVTDIMRRSFKEE